MNGVYSDTTTDRVYKLLPVLAEDASACSPILHAILLLSQEQDDIKALLLQEKNNPNHAGIEELQAPLNSLFGFVLQFGAACYDAGKHTNGGMDLCPQGDRVKCDYMQGKIKRMITELTARKESEEPCCGGLNLE